MPVAGEMDISMVTLGHYGFALFICVLASIIMVLYNYLFSDMKRQKKLLDEKENKLLRLYQSVEDALDDFNDSVERSHTDIETKLKELGVLHAEVERSMRGLAAHAPARIERPAAAPARSAPQQGMPPAQAQPAARMPQFQGQPQYQGQQPAASPAPNIAASIGQAAANIRAAAPHAPAPAGQPAQRPAVSGQPAPQQPQQQQAAPQPRQQAAPQPAPAGGQAPAQAAARPAAAPASAPAQPQAAQAQQTMSPPPAFRRVMESINQAEAQEPAAAPAGRNETIIAMAAEGKPRSQIAKELGITQSEVDLVIGMNK